MGPTRRKTDSEEDHWSPTAVEETQNNTGRNLQSFIDVLVGDSEGTVFVTVVEGYGKTILEVKGVGCV